MNEATEAAVERIIQHGLHWQRKARYLQSVLGEVGQVKTVEEAHLLAIKAMEYILLYDDTEIIDVDNSVSMDVR